MFGMAAIAVLLGCGFASCNKEDDQAKEDDVVVNEKKITKIVRQSDADYLTKRFQYDGNGRLVKCLSESDNYSNTSTLIWKDNTIDLDNSSNWPFEYILTLEDNFVQNEEGIGDGYIYYTYNSSKRLTDILYVADYESELETFQWDGDKIMSISGEDYKISFAYKQTCKRGYFPLFDYFFGWNDHPLYDAHPELIGIRTKQLPESITYNYSENDNGTITCSYEFDTEGYITKIIMKDGNEIETYTLTWVQFPR